MCQCISVLLKPVIGRTAFLRPIAKITVSHTGERTKPTARLFLPFVTFPRELLLSVRHETLSPADGTCPSLAKSRTKSKSREKHRVHSPP